MTWTCGRMGSISVLISLKIRKCKFGKMGSISFKNMKWKFGIEYGINNHQKHEMNCLQCQLKELEQLKDIFVFYQRNLDI